MSAPDVVAYTYRADTFHVGCVLLAMEGDRDPYVPTEARLDRLASLASVDRDDETTFDSFDFPKVIFGSDDTRDMTCGECGDSI